MPTVAEILALDVVQHGLPEVVGGRDGLDREVRWVHISEVPDIAHLLRGGEIVLTSGIALSSERDGLVRFLTELARASAAGVIVELGRRFTHALPASAITVANRLHLPLVELHRAVPFVSVTEAAHSLIFESQLADLRVADQVSSTFMELSLEGASATEILARVARLTRKIVVLENLAHQPLAIDTAGLDARDLLLTWDDSARMVTTTGSTTFDPATGWLVTPVGARGQVWGRLVLVCQEQPSRLDVMTAERASAALALNHLIEQDGSSVDRLAHGSLLVDILMHARPLADTATTAAALGVPLDRGRVVGLVLRLSAEEQVPAGQVRQLSDMAATVAERCRLRAVTGRLSDRAVGMLLALETRHQPDEVIDQYVQMLRQRAGSAGREAAEMPFVVAAGPVVTGAGQARRTLQEANMMAEAALTNARVRPWHSIRDLELRGLFQLLRGNPALAAFIEARIGPLLDYDSRHNSKLVVVLESYLRNGGNKSVTATESHLSRPVLYRRLSLIQRITSVDLEEPESRLSLHAALVAYETLSARGSDRYRTLTAVAGAGRGQA
ncbi:MAG TPA: PucR family transcriptional regulator [Streptosporangiaceae bacterium]|jgi:purine catabolism regulator